MNKITFLFGAGASAEALPIVEKIPERLGGVINFLQKPRLILSNEKFDIEKLKEKTAEEYQKEMIEDLKWLKNKSDEHASVDTFAKKLFLIRDAKQLNRLKHSLSIFLMFEHKLNKPDNRYDLFFPSIINSLSSFPENIRIISWNYDLQFEQVFTQFSGRHISENQIHLNIKEKNSFEPLPNQFGIYKLNGSIFLDAMNGYRKLLYTSDFNNSIDKEFIYDVVQNYAFYKRSSDIKNSLFFAWESDNEGVYFMNSLIQEINDSEVLVVIGYSFPFFNREIDRKLIQRMESLKRVYFQAPDADNLKERFQAIREDISSENLIPKYDIKQFYLPNEL